jgi:ribulose 1,5-bisphosphate synthetase/thiazole synthase
VTAISFTPIAFASLLSAVAGIVSIATLRNLVRAKHSPSRPTVDTTIIETEVIIASKGHRPKIAYRCQLAGKEYERDRLVVGHRSHRLRDGEFAFRQSMIHPYE